MIKNVLILGAGKIGSLVATLLADADDYSVFVADKNFDHSDGRQIVANQRITQLIVDLDNANEIADVFRANDFDAVASCLPYFCNPKVVDLAKEFDLHYFDLTEDVEVTKYVRDAAEGRNKAFVPQCGLAPGYIGIAANTIMQEFDTLDTVNLRVGALPITPNNILKYSLTWSTEGLINEYGNPCQAIQDSEMVSLQPLEGREELAIDGLVYECFNTSGGLATLAEAYLGKVKNLSYKTIRYPGHCLAMRLLMNDLKMNEQRDTFKTILENAIPRTQQDVVLIYVSVTGTRHGELCEKNYLNKVYSQQIHGSLWAGIQVTTAASLTAVIDIVLSSPGQYHGFVRQEAFHLNQIINNRFGHYYVSTQKEELHEYID